MNTIREIPTENIELSPLNPRKSIDFLSLDELAQSISELGVLQPVIVRQVPGKDKFELVCGERRLRATEKAGIETIPAIVKAELSDEAALDMMITENLQRKDVHPLEEAEAFKQLVEQMNYDVPQLIQRFGKSEQYIRQRLKLNDLIDDFKQLFRKEVIGIGHAFEISKLKKDYQQELFNDEFKERNNFWSCPTVRQLKNTIDRNFTTKLDDAVFDIEDKTLNRKAGPCVTCPNNTASNTLLFPEEDEKGVCLDIACFRHKTEMFFDREVERIAKEQPEVKFMRPEYLYNERELKRIERLEKKGYKIITDSAYFEISKPQKPEPPDREDYNMEDPEEKAEYEAELEEYKEEIHQYRESFEEYLKELKNPDNIKGFMLAGRDAGKILVFETRKDYMGSITDDNTLEGKIKKLEQKGERYREIAVEKVHAAAKEILQDSDYWKKTEPLTEVELNALVATMINAFDEEMAKFIYGEGLERYWYVEDKKKIKAILELTPEKRNSIIRYHIQRELSYTSSKTEMKFLSDVAMENFPERIEEVRAKQKEILEKRIANLQKKIDELKAESNA